MNKKLILFIIVLIIGGVYVFTIGSASHILPDNYDCESHPSLIYESNPRPFESSQHYVNRCNKQIQKEIEEVCN